MTGPALPLELQLYILELAAPLCEMTRRRETLKSCSLVHRSWTAAAQRLLFQHLKHTLKSKLYRRSSHSTSCYVDEDDERLERRLRAAPVTRHGQPRSFGAASIRISSLSPQVQNATLTSLASTVSSLCAYWIVKAVTVTELKRFI